MKFGTSRVALHAAILGAACAVTLIASPAAPANAAPSNAASLAAANLGKSAGACADHPTTNTLGGNEFDGSCTGGGSGIPNGPESWCADFVRWAWANSGLNTTGLDSAAESFREYGQNNGTLQSTPAVGDAITFAATRDGYADHVAIVTAVSANGSITLANGNWGGTGNGEAFSLSSSVKATTVPAAQATVGSFASAENFYVTAIVAPTGTAGGTGSNPYTPAQVCGSDFAVIDSHPLTGATVYLLYAASTGDNCVVTLATADTGSVPMNATLAVQGGSSASDPHNYDWYAGPVTENAADACVMWGGAYKSSSWTSAYSHCG